MISPWQVASIVAVGVTLLAAYWGLLALIDNRNPLRRNNPQP